MSRTLLIMAAGTGGHVIPGLAVAEAMRSRGWQVHWLGTRHGMENRLVPPHDIAMNRLNFSGLRGKGPLHTLTGMFKLMAATLSAWRLMGRLRPQVVLGMGGYVTVPGGWAARLRSLPNRASPAIRCVQKLRHWKHRPGATASAAARSSCWWWAAVWVRGP